MRLTAQEWDARRLRATGQEPLNPMSPELIEYHQREQAELEARGDWRNSAMLNAWLCGAVMSEQDFIAGKAPLMRLQFVRRMDEASQAKRTDFPPIAGKCDTR